MSKIKEKLFWEKYRPQRLETVILLPRIKSVVENGLTSNMLFHGSPGTGKSTVANILTKDTNVLKINCSVRNGIDTVREEIYDFCTRNGLFSIPGAMKTVWLEEFDRATPQFQDGLRGFIEEYHEYARFVATVNNINKVSEAMLSRLRPAICFDPINKEEMDFLRNGQLKYLMGISKKIEFNCTEDVLNSIINKNFPDARASVQDLQTMILSGDIEGVLTGAKAEFKDLFEFMLNGKNVIKDNFVYVLENYKERTHDLLLQLGRPFFKHLMDNDDLSADKMFNMIQLSKQYCEKYHDTIDPELHLISYINDIKNILNNK